MCKKLQRENFFSQNHLTVNGVIPNKEWNVYQLEKTKQIICEAVIDSGVAGETVEIAQITDLHFNICNEADEADEEVMYTKKCRTWLADGASIPAADKAMEVAAYFDQTVVTGDVLDYLSDGAQKAAVEHVFSKNKNILCSMGGHDATKQMETNLPDKLSPEEIYSILAKIWPHNIYYASKCVGKVICAALNNGPFGHYFDCQIEKLKADIEKAKREKKIVLVFQHEPVSTMNPADSSVKSILNNNKAEYDFYKGTTNGYCLCMCEKRNPTKTDFEIYNLITNNADVVKGVFCGHLHSLFYVKIPATYTDNEGTHNTFIPQYVLTGNSYMDRVGIVGRIIVK